MYSLAGLFKSQLAYFPEFRSYKLYCSFISQDRFKKKKIDITAQVAELEKALAAENTSKGILPDLTVHMFAADLTVSDV